MIDRMRRLLALLAFGLLTFIFSRYNLAAQSLGNAGTVGRDGDGSVGRGASKATVTIVNRITNYQQTATTDNTARSASPTFRRIRITWK